MHRIWLVRLDARVTNGAHGYCVMVQIYYTYIDYALFDRAVNFEVIIRMVAFEQVLFSADFSTCNGSRFSI